MVLALRVPIGRVRHIAASFHGVRMTTPLIEAIARAGNWDGPWSAQIGEAERFVTAITEAGYRLTPTQDVQCETMDPQDDDGWSEWIHPLPGYLMQCCDCGLIHEMEYAIVPSHENCGDTDLNEGETKDGVIIFRARRAMISAAQGGGE